MEKNKEKILKNALIGDINAFQDLFSEFQNALKSYLYRLLANRNDAEDLLHDTFIKAYDKQMAMRHFLHPIFLINLSDTGIKLK